MYNYKEIAWSGFTNAAGAKIGESSAGLNYGDNKGFVDLPYSETENVSKLIELGTLRGVPGTFIYRATEQVERIGCLNLSADYPTTDTQSITLDTYVADIFSARRIVVQSVCLPTSGNLNLMCGFKRQGATSWLTTTALNYGSAYSMFCVPPRVPNVDEGEYEVGVSTDGGVSWQQAFQQTVYLAGSVDDSMPVSLSDSLLWFKVNPGKSLLIEWDTSRWPNMGTTQAQVIIYGYKRSADGKYVSY